MSCISPRLSNSIYRGNDFLGSSSDEKCRGRSYTPDCEGWKKAGFFTQHESMTYHCKKTCDSCSSGRRHFEIYYLQLKKMPTSNAFSRGRQLEKSRVTLRILSTEIDHKISCSHREYSRVRNKQITNEISNNSHNQRKFSSTTRATTAHLKFICQTHWGSYN